MAKQRSVNTYFWNDPYIETLDKNAKLLFLYLLTSPYTSLCGIFEVTKRKMQFDTGLDKNDLDGAFQQFKTDEKVFYLGGYVFVRNYLKHLSINPSIIMAIIRELSELPNSIINEVNSIAPDYIQTVNSLSTNCDILKLKDKIKPKLKLLKEILSSIETEDGSMADLVEPKKKKKVVSSTEKKLAADAKELIEYWEEKFKASIGTDPAIVAWGRYIKQAKTYVKKYGLKKMKEFVEDYFISDDQFFEKNNWGLNIFFSDSTITKLNK